MTSSMNSAAIGWMIPSYSATMATGGVAAATGPAVRADANRNGETGELRRRERFRMPSLYVAVEDWRVGTLWPSERIEAR